MSKSNNKGFTLLEVLIVSVVILSTLIFMYTQFLNINNSYKRSFTYDNVPSLYMAEEIGLYILNSTGIDSLKEQLSNKNYISIKNGYTGCTSLFYDLVTDANIEELLFTKENVTNLKTDGTIDNNFKKYISKINDTGNGYRIILKFNNGSNDSKIYSYATIKIG